MPYLQIDVPIRYPAEQKQRLARRFGEIYADIMHANIRRILWLFASSTTAESGAAQKESPTRQPF